MATGVIPELMFSSSVPGVLLMYHCLSLPAQKLKLSPLFLLQRNKCVSEREIYTLLSLLEMERDFPVTADAGPVLTH